MLWIDITNLPHVLFFADFIKRSEVFVTTRRFGELENLLDAQGIDYVLVGKHGGGDAKQKLIESAKRTHELARIISRKKISAALAKHSVELPRVAFGLGIPVVQVVDNEYAEHQNRLFLSLCSSVVIPKALDSEKLLLQGARKERLRRFNGICEVAQVKNFKPRTLSEMIAERKRQKLVNVAQVKNPEHEVYAELGLSKYVLIRPEPRAAAYFRKKEITRRMIKELLKLDYNVVVLPRFDEKFTGGKTIKTTDSLNLIYNASALIGGGGTMNREAALLGTPVISYYQQELLGVDKFLIKNKLLFHADSCEDAVKKLQSIADKKSEFRARAKKLLKKIESPFPTIEKELSNLAARSS